MSLINVYEELIKVKELGNFILSGSVATKYADIEAKNLSRRAGSIEAYKIRHIIHLLAFDLNFYLHEAWNILCGEIERGMVVTSEWPSPFCRLVLKLMKRIDAEHNLGLVEDLIILLRLTYRCSYSKWSEEELFINEIQSDPEINKAIRTNRRNFMISLEALPYAKYEHITVSTIFKILNQEVIARSRIIDALDVVDNFLKTKDPEGLRAIIEDNLRDADMNRAREYAKTPIEVCEAI